MFMSTIHSITGAEVARSSLG